MKSRLKKPSAFLLIALTTGLLAACNDKDDDKPIAPSALPPAVVKTVQNALPGFNIEEAEIENPAQTDPAKREYEVEGKTLEGDEYEAEIFGDGRIKKIKLED